MKWWYILIAALDLYLLLSLGPWIALYVLQWLLGRPSCAPNVQQGRLRALQAAEAEQSALWPSEPRTGRYAAPDRAAQQSLSTLRAALNEAHLIVPLLADYVPVQPRLTDALLLRAWAPFIRICGIWRKASSLRRLLGMANEALSDLHLQRQAVGAIPDQVHTLLLETRAQCAQWNASLEAELKAGTCGLEGLAQQLQTIAGEIDRALRALAQASPDELPRVVQQIDEALATIARSLEEIGQLVQQATAERNKAQNALARLDASLQLAAERWEGLRSRGATEPAIARSLAELQEQAEKIRETAQQRSREAYRQVEAEVSALVKRFESLMLELDALDRIVQQSKEAVAGDVQALAQAQAMCDELLRQDPLIELDQTSLCIEKASQTYIEAERQRGLGTIQSYKLSLNLAHEALQHLSEARAMASSVPDRVRQVRELLAAMDAAELGEWRQRAERVREQLRFYARHWNAGLAGMAGEATSHLDQVEVDLERISPNVRYQRRFRESELGEALDMLTHAQNSMARAQELTVELEEEHRRIEGLRQEVKETLDRIATQTIPAVQALSQRMLPELRQRLEAVLAAFNAQAATLADSATVNYDEAATTWLPSVRQQIEEIQEEYEDSVRHYRARLQEVSKQLERQAARLKRLDPRQQPRPEEDADRLMADLEAWRMEAGQKQNDPLALRELVGRRAEALAQRMETIQDQIVIGRRTLEQLGKQYERQAQAVRDLRTKVQSWQQQSEWPQLIWDTGEAEQNWRKAAELERESRSAPTLTQANDQLQKAIYAAQQAEQLYTRLAHQMNKTLRLLDEEHQAVHRSLQRAQERMEQFAQNGLIEESRTIERAMASCRRALEMARAAGNAEDALRYLRDAREAL